MGKVVDYETNIPKSETRDVPVREFLRKEMGLEKRIGGLLDYGYSPRQIADMVHTSWHEVLRTMQNKGYKEINKLKVLLEGETEWGVL